MVEIKDIELFLLDMDGTVYIENQLIDGSEMFLSAIIENKKKYIFLTNNSSINKDDYLVKLKNMGIPCGAENIFSSGMAAGLFLSKNRKGKKVFLVGTEALAMEMNKYEVKLTEKNPDIVLVGFDREICYRKIEKACEFLDNGAEFIATNPDLLYPIKNKRFIPDCGSICHMLTVATKKKPLYIGKPNRYIIDILIEKTGFPRENVVLIGDRLYTDIAAGINADINTILVLSGETNLHMLKESSYQPDLVIPSIKELIKLL
ncbi:MAG: HAD-IIA family hydrolase [Bacilli bacterium]|nr:HAD-IIA family hydrolase [Bacilli bacterium]MDD4076475.1 HAD-IIA family hydrolase [Bacilli bacterium]MDD4387811.1 HAD-IIA family hydrolase [Bacilli bacterium]